MKFGDIRTFLRKIYPATMSDKFVYIVGAQKAGTTSLHSFLVCHPDIVGAKGKEAHFFDQDSVYEKGLEYYSFYFPLFSSKKIFLDSTPSYLYNKRSPERIHSFRPESKIIILLREPVSRAFSAFNMYKQAVGNTRFIKQLMEGNTDAKRFFLPIAEGKVSPDIDCFLSYELEMMAKGNEGEEPALIRRGIYAPQIERYVDLFGSENVMVLFSDDLKNRTAEIVNKVFSFIGLESGCSIQLTPRHVREYTVDQSEKEKIHQAADDLFAKDKKTLIDHYQLNVPW